MQPNVLCADIKDILFYFLFLSFYTFSVTNMFDNKEKKSSIFLIEYT